MSECTVGAMGAPPLKRFSLSRLIIVGFAISGFAWLAALSFQRVPLTAALFCLAWMPVGVTNVVGSAMRQTYVPEDIIGRVSSVSFSASVVVMPIGSLLGGIAGDAWGTTVVMIATGIGFLFVMLYWVANPLLRHIPPIGEIDPSKYGLGNTRSTDTIEHSSTDSDVGSD